MFGALSHLSTALRAPPAKRVLVVNGHPDPDARRFCAAVCAAYAEGAQSRGYATQRLDVGALTLPGADGDRWLWDEEAEVLERLMQADRLFIAFPMWLGGPPPALRVVLEEFARWQVSRTAKRDEPVEVKDAHIVATASLPGLIYRTNRGAPVGDWATSISGRRVTQAILIGSVESMSQEDRGRWLSDVRRFGSSRLGCAPGRAVLG